MKHTLDEAKILDSRDEFPALSHLFDLPLDKKSNTAIYLNGNSLGPKPKNTDSGLNQQCQLWGQLGGRGHSHQKFPWARYNEFLLSSLVPLLGANTKELVITGTLTANIHSLFVSFYQPTPTRYKIIRLAGFPSDTYALASQVKQRLQTVQNLCNQRPFALDDAIIEIKADNNGYISLETFKQVIDEHGDSTAIIWIEAVHYLTGQYFNIKDIAALAQAKGCKIGLDLAHGIGNVPLYLDRWNIDFAVWCSYKYLSAGPGAIAGLYVNERYHSDPSMTLFAGWWGHNKSTRFVMPNVFDPIPSAEAWQVSNPTIFSIEALRQALMIFDKVDFLALREKNKRLVAYLELLITEELSQAIHILTPKNPEERGCQLSLRLKRKLACDSIEELFYEHGIICDVRGDLIRVAAMGLYTTFSDLFLFVERTRRMFE